MRKVAILTPSHSGDVCARFMTSLVQSIKVCAMQGIDLCPVIVPGQAILSHARDYLLKLAVESGVEDAIWIDADMGWEPDWIMKLLLMPVDVVSGTARRKSFNVSYVCRANPDQVFLNGNGLIEVTGTGFAFTRMTRKAMLTLASVSQPYNQQGIGYRAAFETTVVNEEFVSEDISACNKLRTAGIKIFLDPALTCTHTGAATFEGDFLKYLIDNKLLKEPPHDTGIVSVVRKKAVGSSSRSRGGGKTRRTKR